MTSASSIRIHRSPAVERFTIHHNRVLQDNRLSWKALGLLSYLLSLPKKWRLNLQHLASLRQEGRHSTRSALTELEKYGYVSKHQIRDSQGRFIETRWDVTDTPHQAQPAQSENPPSENPISDNQQLEKTEPQKAAIHSKTTTAPPLQTLEQLLAEASPEQKALYEAITAKVPLWIKNEPGWRLALARKARAGQLTGRVAESPPPRRH